MIFKIYWSPLFSIIECTRLMLKVNIRIYIHEYKKNHHEYILFTDEKILQSLLHNPLTKAIYIFCCSILTNLPSPLSLIYSCFGLIKGSFARFLKLFNDQRAQPATIFFCALFANPPSPSTLVIKSGDQSSMGWI